MELSDGQNKAMTRALVLGGGGLVGIAWEIGILTGLAEAGCDLSGPLHESGHQPDSIIGTSAGSVVGSLLGTVGLGDMATMALDDARASVAMDNLPLLDFALMEECFAAWRILPDDSPESLAVVGRMALKFDGVGEERYVQSMVNAVGHEWLDGRFRCTSVNANDGSFAVWGASSGVSLALAVASSCAVPTVFPPVTIEVGGESARYVDGGVRSGTSIDLVAGADRILVLAPIGSWRGDALDPAAAAAVVRETALAEAAGSAVITLYPDDVTNTATMYSPLTRMDPGARLPALEHGVRQGRALAQQLRGWW